MYPRTILAVDPGNEESAYVLLDRYGNKIQKFNKVLNGDLKSILRANVADIVVFEMIACYGMPVGKEVFETCLWIGRFLESCSSKTDMVYRKDIKLGICGTVKAKDANIRQAMIDRWGEPGTKNKPGPTYGISKDIWAALAVGTHYIDTLNLKQK